MKSSFQILLSILMFFSSLELAQTATAPSGSGTSANPYQIATWQNLYWISQNSNQWNKYYIQTANIDFTIASPALSSWNSGAGWLPIGNSTTKFTGSYNGQNYTINGLFINRSSTDNVGLFGYTDGVTISNLGLTNGSVSGHSYVGTLIGNCYGGTISYCYNTGSVTGSAQIIGGLIGNTINSCTVNYCYNTGTVKATSATDWTYLGGLVGQNTWSTLSNSYNRGSVTSGYAPVGGLVGYNNTDGGVVTNCFSTGSVTGYTGTIGGLNRLGGLIGDCCSGSVTNSYWDSQTAGTTASPSGKGTAKTTAQMKTQSTYSGWDFTKVWEIVGGDGANYPTLRNVSAPPPPPPPPPPTTSCGEQVLYAGKTYNTVKIGNQCWLKENLDVGTMIQITQNPENNSVIEKYCYSNNSTNCDAYGGLYQWNEAMAYASSEGARGICPEGWHIPTLEEFQTLSKTVGDNSYALKAKVPVDPDATNSSGFTALFGGLYNTFSNFSAIGYYLYMWSSSQKLIGFPNFIFMTYITSNINLASSASSKDAFSIRCIKDNSSTDISEELNQNNIPHKFTLEQNYPNPFNPSTTIRYSIPSFGNVKLTIFDLLGREVKLLINEYKTPGTYDFVFNASGLSSGVYFYKLSSSQQSIIRKLTLAK